MEPPHAAENTCFYYHPRRNKLLVRLRRWPNALLESASASGSGYGRDFGMNKDAVRINQIDLPAVFPSIRLLESLRAACSIPCLMAAAIVYAGFQVDLDASFNGESLDLTTTLAPFVSTTIAKWIFNIEAIFVFGSTRGLAVVATLALRMLCVGFGVVGIARCAALLVSRNERSGILRTGRFIAGCWKPVVVSTSLTIAIGLMVLLFFRTVGHLSKWISPEADVASLSNIVFWLCSLGTLIGIYVVLTGWLLGLSAIAVDRVDGPEALSRGISYVLSRFRRTFCILIIITMISKLAGYITWWCMTLAGSVGLRSISQNSAPHVDSLAAFAAYRGWGVECIQLSTFCSGLAIAYLILRQMIDNLDHLEISDQM